MGILRPFGLKKPYKKNQQYSQRFSTIPSLHTKFSIRKCPNIPIILIAYKEIQHILVHGYLYQNVPLILSYILLTRRLTHCGLRVSTHFSLDISRQLGIKNHKTKNQHYSQICFKLYQLFMNNFISQTGPKSKLLTT